MEFLAKKLDSYTAEDNFESQNQDVSEKIDSPGGPALLGIVGYVYISVSELNLHLLNGLGG